jgi:hypothetical protein
MPVVFFANRGVREIIERASLEGGFLLFQNWRVGASVPGETEGTQNQIVWGIDHDL